MSSYGAKGTRRPNNRLQRTASYAARRSKRNDEIRARPAQDLGRHLRSANRERGFQAFRWKDNMQVFQP